FHIGLFNFSVLMFLFMNDFCAKFWKEVCFICPPNSPLNYSVQLVPASCKCQSRKNQGKHLYAALCFLNTSRKRSFLLCCGCNLLHVCHSLQGRCSGRPRCWCI